MSSSDSSFSVCKSQHSAHLRRLFMDRIITFFLLLLSGGLSGGSSATSSGSSAGGGGTTGADVGQEILDVLALKSL